MQFEKYHALGNDYLVLNATSYPAAPGPETIRLICHRNFGLGSDGILHGPMPSKRADFGLRIYNPDGGEAEKSGNGIRIFSRFLWDSGLMKHEAVSIDTLGGVVRSRALDDAAQFEVEMGKVTFLSSEIPVSGPAREVLHETIEIDGQEFRMFAASIGNPHCVIPVPAATPEMAKTIGPGIESDSMFPNRTNVQFLEIIDRENIRIEIWERGAGYTLASGSSSSAAAAVAHRMGSVDNAVTVHMPGGKLRIEIAAGYEIVMTGPVTRIGTMEIDPEALAQ